MLSDYQALVAALIRDDAGIVTDDDLAAAIGLAVARYSQDRPRVRVADLAAQNAEILGLPDGYDVEFSAVLSLEYPVGQFPESFLENTQYSLYQTPEAVVLRLGFAPDGAVRCRYTVAHELGAEADTLPAKHREAVCCWAAALCCDQLSSFYANASDSTIQADHVQRGSQSKDYAVCAANLRKRYLNELGIEDKKAQPAGAVVNLNRKTSLGQDRFTHSNRYR